MEENSTLTSLGCYVPVTYIHIFSVLYIMSLYISWDENLESYDLHSCQFYIVKTCIVRDSFFLLSIKSVRLFWNGYIKYKRFN